MGYRDVLLPQREDGIGSHEGLIDSGKKKVRIIPLFVAFDGPSALKARMEIESFGLETEFSRPISHLESFNLILDSKVPEGW